MLYIVFKMYWLLKTISSLHKRNLLKTKMILIYTILKHYLFKKIHLIVFKIKKMSDCDDYSIHHVIFITK